MDLRLAAYMSRWGPLTKTDLSPLREPVGTVGVCGRSRLVFIADKRQAAQCVLRNGRAKCRTTSLRVLFDRLRHYCLAEDVIELLKAKCLPACIMDWRLAQ